MQKVKNLTNSPYDLQSVKGNIRLPAFGEVEGEFSGEYLDLLRASGAVSIEESATRAAPANTASEDKPKRTTRARKD